MTSFDPSAAEAGAAALAKCVPTAEEAGANPAAGLRAIADSFAGVALPAALGDADRAQTRIDIAMAQFTRVIEPHHLKKTLAEVERRAAFMGMANAYDSVRGDIVAGRWEL